MGSPTPHHAGGLRLWTRLSLICAGLVYQASCEYNGVDVYLRCTAGAALPGVCIFRVRIPRLCAALPPLDDRFLRSKHHCSDQFECFSCWKLGLHGLVQEWEQQLHQHGGQVRGPGRFSNVLGSTGGGDDAQSARVPRDATKIPISCRATRI